MVRLIAAVGGPPPQANCALRLHYDVGRMPHNSGPAIIYQRRESLQIELANNLGRLRIRPTPIMRDFHDFVDLLFAPAMLRRRTPPAQARVSLPRELWLQVPTLWLARFG